MNLEIKHLPANEQYMFCRELSTTVKTAADMLNIMHLIETHSEYTTEFDWLIENISETFDVKLIVDYPKLNVVGDDVLFICTILIENENGKVITDEQENGIVNTMLNYFLNKQGE
jgi:DNA-binding ferritin-like protein (Dps family)